MLVGAGRFSAGVDDLTRTLGFDQLAVFDDNLKRVRCTCVSGRIWDKEKAWSNLVWYLKTRWILLDLYGNYLHQLLGGNVLWQENKCSHAFTLRPGLSLRLKPELGLFRYKLLIVHASDS